MATCLQLALTNPVAGQDKEFNRWYDDEHLVHGVRTPGMLAGQRFRRATGPWPPGKHDYLAIYEIDDPVFAVAQLAKARGTDAMPISPAIDMTTVQPPLMWRRATVRTGRGIATDTSQRGSIVLMLANAAEAQADAFEAALLHGGLAELADEPGVLAAELLTLANEQLRGSARKYAFGLLLDLDDEARVRSSLEGRLRALRHLDAERWFAAVFRPIGRRLTQQEARARAERG
jgi:hypothetical protein